jgi:hypothetical protein
MCRWPLARGAESYHSDKLCESLKPQVRLEWQSWKQPVTAGLCRWIFQIFSNANRANVAPQVVETLTHMLCRLACNLYPSDPSDMYVLANIISLGSAYACGLMLGPWYVLRIVDSCCRWGRLDRGRTDDQMAYLDAILSPSRPHRSAVLKHTV